jgi:rSAM/selenodomain-associated transferase 1
MKEALILFVKKPVEGKVKTRLAVTIGDKKAVAIYKKMLTNVEKALQPLTQQIFVYTDEKFHGFFSSYSWELQKGNDLGEKMYQAFEEVFAKGFDKISIIGSDCYELTTAIIQESFTKNKNAILGPSADGGYYLLGLTQNHHAIFSQIDWSTEKVFRQTIKQLDSLSISPTVLPTLTDIDDWEDLKQFTELMK